MKRFIQNLLNEKAIAIIAATIAFYALLNFISREFIMNDTLMYNTLTGQIPDKYIDDVIAFQHKWNWVYYLAMPVLLLIKWLFISAFIATVVIFRGYKISFGSIFKTVVVAEWLFILVGIANSIVLMASNIQSISDIQNLNIIANTSLGQIFKEYQPVSWLITPLYSLNIFQLIYMILLTVGIGSFISESNRKKLSLVVTGYGSLLLIWIMLITYINISYA